MYHQRAITLLLKRKKKVEKEKRVTRAAKSSSMQVAAYMLRTCVCVCSDAITQIGELICKINNTIPRPYVDC
jgi:hypothetical protein